MDQIWAPWRAQFVQQARPVSTAPEPCFFCEGIAGADDKASLLVWRNQSTVVFLNRYPYNNGHLLVAPVAHEGVITQLAPRELLGTLETIQSCVRILDTILNPQGYNIGLNLGKSAGAGIPGHLHWHIVPRWDGDTNFMPVLSDTKVIVECLEGFYERFSAERSRST